VCRKEEETNTIVQFSEISFSFLRTATTHVAHMGLDIYVKEEKPDRPSSFLRCVHSSVHFTDLYLPILFHFSSTHTPSSGRMTEHNMKQFHHPKVGPRKEKKREEINKDGQFYHFTLYTQPSMVGREKDAEHIKHIKLHVHDYIDLRK
jgi:hypothetical protein